LAADFAEQDLPNSDAVLFAWDLAFDQGEGIY
jgi:hypothetical protein